MNAHIEDAKPNCMMWAGAKTIEGYGMLARERAHRLIYEALVAPIPEGMHILHKCDVPPCINPDHLFVGTNADNQKDKTAKFRHGDHDEMFLLRMKQIPTGVMTCRKCGETKPLSRFTKYNQSQLGYLLRCKDCAAAHSREWYYKKKEAMR